MTYLARYLRGGPLKHARLVAWDGDRVTCIYRARSEETDGGAPAPQRMIFSSADFLRRWLLHVPTPRTRMIRSYGLYHPTHAEALTERGSRAGNGPDDGGLIRRKLHSARWGRPGQAVSGRGLSNKELKLTPGSAKGA